LVYNSTIKATALVLSMQILEIPAQHKFVSIAFFQVSSYYIYFVSLNLLNKLFHSESTSL